VFRFSPASLAQMSARHPWRVLGVWLVVIALSFVAMSGLGDALTSSSNFTGKPESAQGDDLLKSRLRGDKPVMETVVVHSDAVTVDDAAFKTVVEKTSSDLVAMDGVIVSAPTYYQALANAPNDAAGMVSKDRHSTVIPVTFAGAQKDAEKHVDDYLAVIAKQGDAGVKVLTVGDLSVNDAFNHTASSDLGHSEKMTLPLTILILVFVFGALIAVGVPLILSVVSIIVALGLTAILGHFTDLSFFVVNMITMIGLAVGIDYTLFIVSRYREERRRGYDKHAAITIAGGTATKAVLFSGATVVLALMGMFLIPLTVFHSLGAGAVLVVVVAVAGTLTLVPALLGLLGDKIDWPRKPRPVAARPVEGTGFWGKITHVVMARPAIFTILSIVLLAACALPYVDLQRGAAGVDTLPKSDVKSGYELLAKDFSAGMIAPIEIVLDGRIDDPQTQAGIAAFKTELAKDSLYGAVTVTVNPDHTLALLSVPVQADSSSETAVNAVKDLRARVLPAAFGSTPVTTYVSGGPAFNADYFGLVDDSTSTVFVFVLGLSFLLLLIAFRSVVIAAKAIVMNLLSVGASYGLLVLVFQKGYLHNVFGFQKSPEIEAWVPLFLFCVLFGLSMDYHVFLLSRIREHFDLTGRNRESVAVGLQSTGKIITGAALIMVVVFAGFSTGQLVSFQQMGFGMAVAVFLDATIVRSILVPSAMALLGARNWWLPSWLTWLPNVNIEGSASAPAAMPAD
jgi:RND superfamily putative drug exporter